MYKYLYTCMNLTGLLGQKRRIWPSQMKTTGSNLSTCVSLRFMRWLAMICALYSLISLQIQPRPYCNSDSTCWWHLDCQTKLTLLESPEEWSKGLRWLDAALHSCLCSRDRSLHVRKGPSDLEASFLSTLLAFQLHFKWCGARTTTSSAFSLS